MSMIDHKPTIIFDWHPQRGYGLFIPNYAIDSCDDATLVAAIRRARVEIDFYQIQRFAEWLIHFQSSHAYPDISQADMQARVPLLEQYRGMDDTIDAALAIVDRKQVRDAARAARPRLRYELQKERESVLLALVERDGSACVRCGSPDKLTIDHRVALINGGTNDTDNLQLLCASCNSSKGDRP